MTGSSHRCIAASHLTVPVVRQQAVPLVLDVTQLCVNSAGQVEAGRSAARQLAAVCLARQLAAGLRPLVPPTLSAARVALHRVRKPAELAQDRCTHGVPAPVQLGSPRLRRVPSPVRGQGSWVCMHVDRIANAAVTHRATHRAAHRAAHLADGTAAPARALAGSRSSGAVASACSPSHHLQPRCSTGHALADGIQPTGSIDEQPGRIHTARKSRESLCLVLAPSLIKDNPQHDSWREAKKANPIHKLGFKRASIQGTDTARRVGFVHTGQAPKRISDKDAARKHG
eukprot:CAMPEP_0181251076 /NCGR_PEP_ID=MMETSP1096-20121128/46676_1 /TAXON_ID=156174 ORGANISM="Chrysochromulina ericina, Strain CCMP281" /NCGR_SAMPLE_ID=MMETSP1096 /ASSEMBLY_ACC=CAM_ASM_000453 /LENGTH=284 /DNA_ID=CAMNT_0023348619 /DNA_START=317 /DNA_END=1171 /DNA_ORIENTATION=+